MPIDPTLLELVACPKCKGELTVQRAGAPGGASGDAAGAEGFACKTCKLFYAVEDDIPNFLIDEARPLEP